MKKHEWHSVMMGILGFVLLVGYQNCGRPNNKENSENANNDQVKAFSSVKCVMKDVSDYNELSEPNFNETIYEDYDIFYNDVDCDSYVDAMLVSFDDPRITLTCFNYQEYGFGNCYPQTTEAYFCVEDSASCGVSLKSLDIPVLNELSAQTLRAK